MKILVLTTESLPLPGLPATGAGLRAWGLAFGLRSAGFDNVELAFAADAIRGKEHAFKPIPGVSTFERSRLGEFVAEQSPDIIVLQHWGLASVLPPGGKWLLAIDLAGPHLLERRLWDSPDPAADLREKLAALARADHVVCSGEFQRHYFIPFLLQAGFAPAENLCPAIPFSLSPDLPAPPPDRDWSAFISAGFFLPWQDPSHAIDVTLDTMDKRDRGSMVLIGGPHPSGDVSGGRYNALLEKLSASPRVRRHGVLSFEEYLAILLRCGVALDLFPRNPERELAFPTRTVVAMWAGVPVIHGDYDELSGLIRESRAGWVVTPGDTRGLAKIVERLVGHTEDIQRRSEYAQALVRERLTWDKTIEPLAAWCRQPVRRTKSAPVAVAAAPVTDDKKAAPRAPKPARKRERISYSPPPPVAGPNRLQQVLSPLALLVALPVSVALLLLFGLGELLRVLTRRK